MEDQLLIRNHAFPFYSCAIKQMFIFRTNEANWIDLLREGRRGKDRVNVKEKDKVCECEKEVNKEKVSVCQREGDKVSDRVFARRICTVLICWPDDHFDLVSLYFMI